MTRQKKPTAEELHSISICTLFDEKLKYNERKDKILKDIHFLDCMIHHSLFESDLPEFKQLNELLRKYMTQLKSNYLSNKLIF